MTQQDAALFARYFSGYAAPDKLPTAFFCGGEKIEGLPASASPEKRTVKSPGKTDTVYVGRIGGLKIETTVTVYDDYPVWETVSWYENEGDAPTPLLSDILAFTGAFEAPSPYLCYNTGDYFSEDGYEDHWEKFPSDILHRFTPQTGRSCDHCFPYFKLEFGDGTGMNVAIGWPAQWMAEFYLSPKSVRLASGQETTRMTLDPGEKIRTPKITLMPYAGDYDYGVNLWRRWYNEFIMPRPGGEPIKAHLSTLNGGGGVEFTCATEENQITALHKAASQMPYTVWWIDAGWYPCHTPDGRIDWTWSGDWYADPDRFPNGLGPVSRALKEHGMQLLLWFEPERVHMDTRMFDEPPEWLLRCKNPLPVERSRFANGLFDMGNKEACDWMIDHVDGLIKDYGIGIYRQDFNFPPLPFWRATDAPDKQGFHENAYVQGYLRYWDALLERNPGLMIDSCSAGGRRNDLETMRRAVPLHPTDWGYGYHTHQQAFSRTLYKWTPYIRLNGANWEDGKGGWQPAYKPDHTRADRVGGPMLFFDRVSNLSPFTQLVLHGDATQDEKDFLRVWQETGQLMITADYYPLTETTKRADSWFINEFYSPEQGRGFFQALRNIHSKEETYTVFPKNLDPGKTYRLEDLRTGEVTEKSGEALAKEGITFRLAQREAQILLIRAE